MAKQKPPKQKPYRIRSTTSWHGNNSYRTTESWTDNPDAAHIFVARVTRKSTSAMDIIEEVEIKVTQTLYGIQYWGADERTAWLQEKKNFEKLTPVQLVEFRKLGYFDFLKTENS